MWAGPRSPFFFVFGRAACYMGLRSRRWFQVSPVLVKEVSTRPGFEETMAGRKKPLVVITRKLPDHVETRMRELFDARIVVEDRPMTQPELVAAVKEADVLVPT